MVFTTHCNRATKRMLLTEGPALESVPVATVWNLYSVIVNPEDHRQIAGTRTDPAQKRLIGMDPHVPW